MSVAPTVLHSGTEKLSAACAPLHSPPPGTASLVQLGTPDITSGFLAALSARAISLASEGRTWARLVSASRVHEPPRIPGGRDHGVQRGTSR